MSRVELRFFTGAKGESISQRRSRIFFIFAENKEKTINVNKKI